MGPSTVSKLIDETSIEFSWYEDPSATSYSLFNSINETIVNNEDFSKEIDSSYKFGKNNFNICKFDLNLSHLLSRYLSIL